MTVGAALWILIAYKFHQSMIDARDRRREVTRRRSRGSTICWKTSASRAASPMPKLKVMEDDALNAFATGLNDKQYSITVTTGLLDGSTTPSSRRCSATSSPISATATCACW